MTTHTKNHAEWTPVVICLTCGRRTVVSPSKFETRRYCNRVCFENRPRHNSIAADVLRKLGGVTNVARLLNLPHRRVRSWVQNGVPVKYRADLMALSDAAGAGVTRRMLADSYADGVARRKARRVAREIEIASSADEEIQET